MYIRNVLFLTTKKEGQISSHRLGFPFAKFVRQYNDRFSQRLNKFILSYDVQFIFGYDLDFLKKCVFRRRDIPLIKFNITPIIR